MLILASKSPRRISLLRQHNINFISIPSDIDENCNSVYPEYMPLFLAAEKASVISAQYPDNLVLGVDTVISFKNKVIGKPDNIEHAKSILKCLSGSMHSVISGVCLLNNKKIFSVFSQIQVEYSLKKLI